MSNAEQVWIYQQEEPTDILVTGTYRRHKELPRFMAARESIEKMREIEEKYPDFKSKAYNQFKPEDEL